LVNGDDHVGACPPLAGCASAFASDFGGLIANAATRSEKSSRNDTKWIDDGILSS
jgi:hypothetical protein